MKEGDIVRFKSDASMPEGFTHPTYWDGPLTVVKVHTDKPDFALVTNEYGHGPINVHESEIEVDQ